MKKVDNYKIQRKMTKPFEFNVDGEASPRIVQADTIEEARAITERIQPGAFVTEVHIQKVPLEDVIPAADRPDPLLSAEPLAEPGVAKESLPTKDSLRLEDRY